MARYEFSDGKSNKFWEVEVDGDTVNVCYGRLGTDGQTSTKVYSSAAEAQAQADKQAKSKMKKGYALVESKAASKPKKPASAGDELLAAVQNDPSDTSAWSVYADFLQGEGDPRGELLALGLQLAEKKSKKLQSRVDELIAEHREKWLTKELHEALADWNTDEWPEDEVQLQLQWHYETFIRAVKVRSGWEGEPTDKTWRALVKLPIMDVAEEIRVGLPPAEDAEAEFPSSILALAKGGKRPSVRTLIVGDYEFPDETEITWTNIGNAGSLLPVFPNLTRFEVQGGSIEIAKLEHKKLEHVEIRTAGLPKKTVKAVGSAVLPECTHLEVWLGNDERGFDGNVGQLKNLLQGKGVPKLKYLGLKNSEITDDLAKALAKAPILDQLEVLDLSLGTLTDAGARALLNAKTSLKKLKKLDLDENFLSDEMCEELTAALGNVVYLPNQEEPDEDDGEIYTYISVSE